ncbi:hypothetical protein JCM8547_003487 [Rhodosporidiobolus lusitaniae]
MSLPSVRWEVVLEELKKLGLPERAGRGLGWIDGLKFLAWGKTVEKAVAAAQRIVSGLENWSDSHFSAFKPSKTLLTLFVLPGKKNVPPIAPPVILRSEPLAYSPSLTLHGIEIDSTLLFRNHRSSCVAKASSALTGVRLLSRTRAGLRPGMVKSLVKAALMPR